MEDLSRAIGLFARYLPILLRGRAGHTRQPEAVAVDDEQLRRGGTAQPGGMFDDGVEHRTGVGDVASQCGQDLAAGDRLLTGSA